MNGDTVTAALEGAAQTLHAAARAHKRSEAQHRRQARDLMRRFDELRAALAERGIDLLIDTDPQEGRPQS